MLRASTHIQKHRHASIKNAGLFPFFLFLPINMKPRGPHFFEDHRFPNQPSRLLFDSQGNHQSTPSHCYYDIPRSPFNFFLPITRSPRLQHLYPLLGCDGCLLYAAYSSLEEIFCHTSSLCAQGRLCLSQGPWCCHVP